MLVAFRHMQHNTLGTEAEVSLAFHDVYVRSLKGKGLEKYRLVFLHSASEAIFNLGMKIEVEEGT